MKTTIKSIQAKYPDFNIVGKSKNYDILHKPTNSWCCCILSNCDLPLIEELIEEQQKRLDEGRSFNPSYFRIPETQEISLNHAEIHQLFDLIRNSEYGFYSDNKNAYLNKVTEILSDKLADALDRN